ncbi:MULTISPECIES: DUF5133 domain-containing protein [unclassified Streptomyces]|uniref:DUF5133 domain-containing protein n=1 Tax=unclassified Streptomyces TaxID=2593676 RepID=UPI0033F22B5E
MITPHPQILRSLLSRYATARVQLVENDTLANRRLLEDVAYTLCVTTGTREIEDALATAERFLTVEPADAAVAGTAAGQEQADQTLVA